MKELSSVILLVIMGGGFYTHFALNDSFERMAPSLIFGLLIVCRLIILHQVTNKEKRDLEMLRKFLEEAQATADGTGLIEDLIKNGKHEDEAASSSNGVHHSATNGAVDKKIK